MELLAPVGSIETFHAALDGGADAVYMGAPGINARNLSRDLRLEEIAAMIEYAREHARKVYLAANSLLLENDLAGIVRTLSLFAELRPDALIVQDVGLIRIVKRFFPDLELHASTLAGAHNSDTLALFAELGCSRVVTARELTIREIAELQRKSTVELEVFVHGAMCYSYSGLCMFSSFLGGKSSLRGRCVQPCRRGYSWQGKGERKRTSGKHSAGGYFFSMNDLEGFEIIPALREMGVACVKIEGRMRSANYVSNIVRAYRKVIDADEENRAAAVKQAMVLAEAAMSRKTSTGYFGSPQPADAITHHHSGNLGIHLGSLQGKVPQGKVVRGKITLKKELRTGDRLRLHFDDSGERKPFTLRSMTSKGQPVDSAGAGEEVSLELPAELDTPGRGRIQVYKVDVASTAVNPVLSDRITAHRQHIAGFFKKKGKELLHLERQITGGSQPTGKNGGGGGKGPGRREKKSLETWLKTDSPRVLFSSRLPFLPDVFMLPLEKKLLSNSSRIRNHFRKNIRNIVWALPPVILEQDRERVSKQIRTLIRSGFRNFQLSHLGQRRLFARERVHLYGDYTLNIGNSAAMASVAESGVEGCQAAIELDREGFAGLAAGVRGQNLSSGKGGKSPAPGRGIRLGITVFGAPPLFTSRLGAPHFNYKKELVSPKGELFRLLRQDGLVMTVPVKPFSLLPYRQELAEMGYDYMVIDICRLDAAEKILGEVGERISGKQKLHKLPAFNYLGKLE